MKENKKIYYVCFYSEKDEENRLLTFPSSIPKIEYIINSLKINGYHVNLLSASYLKVRGVFKKKKVIIDLKERHTYFFSFYSKSSILNKLGMKLFRLNLIFYLLIHVRKGDCILVYHSLFYFKFFKLIKEKFYLEIEDVYSALNEENKKYWKEEWDFFQLAKGYLCVNDRIAAALPQNKRKVVSYGSYTVDPEVKKKHNSKKIKLVYAGIIEQERRAAFIAVEAMLFLPERFELEILGFGKKEDLDILHCKIHEINLIFGRTAVIFYGRMEGKKYGDFLSSCDIALSTHSYDEKTMISADYTFPSKVLVYLAHNLHIVAQRIECLENCCLKEYITFYEKADPEQVAQAVLKVHWDENIQSSDKIKIMDQNFKEQINLLFNEISKKQD